jgi:O-antigen ligase
MHLFEQPASRGNGISTGEPSRSDANTLGALRLRRLEKWLAGLAVCAVPGSIAVSETLLGSALLLRFWGLYQDHASTRFPRALRVWAILAALETVSWLASPNRPAGFGEMRHMLLIAVVLVLAPAFGSARDRVAIWRGIIAVATISSTALIARFVYRLLFYRGTLAAIVYLRGGGLLHHWMVYSTVEIVVFAGLIEMRRSFDGGRKWVWVALAINAIAVLLSLTRMLWICCLLLVALDFLWIRSRRIWAVPLIPCLAFVVLPDAVRMRITDSATLEYYSNAERLQMLRVGLRMIRDKPWTGVGPGRVEEVYTKYLAPGDRIPAYHGHLHNNFLQFGAEFGLPVLAAALFALVILYRNLWLRSRHAIGREEVFLCRTALLGLTGFVTGGLFDYTYGHSLGLILLAFAMLSPLSSGSPSSKNRFPRGERQNARLSDSMHSNP